MSCVTSSRDVCDLVKNLVDYLSREICNVIHFGQDLRRPTLCGPLQDIAGLIRGEVEEQSTEISSFSHFIFTSTNPKVLLHEKFGDPEFPNIIEAQD